jgi:hypothetical protein
LGFLTKEIRKEQRKKRKLDSKNILFNSRLDSTRAGLCFRASGWILMKDSVLETLLVEDSMNKKTSQNFKNFIVKFGSKAEIC